MMKVRLSRILGLCLTLTVVCTSLIGCGEEEKPDPVMIVKSMLPTIEAAINSRDLKWLDKMSSDRFDPEKFMEDVYRNGVRGDISMAFQRLRSVSGEITLTTNSRFGPQGSGGMKEIAISFTPDDLKLDTYSILDKFVPPPVDKNILKEPAADSSADSSL